MRRVLIIFSLSLFVLFLSVSSCFASELYPKVTDVITKDYYEYIVYTLPNNGKITARVVESDDKNVIDGVRFSMANPGSMNQYRFAVESRNADIVVKQYLLEDGAWVSISTTSIATKGYQFFEEINHPNNPSTIYESTKNVCFSGTDNIFFPLTLPVKSLPEAVMEMIAEQVPVTGTQVVGTMRVLLLCGVGCLALVICLPLLLKVFRRLRVR